MIPNLEIPQPKKQEKEESVENKKFNHKEWSEEDYAILLGNVEILKNTDNFKQNPAEYEQKSFETYQELKQYFEDYGAQYYEDVNNLYNIYSTNNDTKIVRRENPTRIIELVRGKPIELNFDPDVVGDRGDKYANCALWPHGSISKTNGIANAFLEGRGMAGPIVLLGGYTPNPTHMLVEEPKDKMLNVGTISRENVKIVSGSIKKEDLDFVIMRIASKFFNQEDLTEQEKDLFNQGKLSQVFRGFKFK